MVPVKDTMNRNYKVFFDMLGRFEENNLMMYTDGNTNKFIVGNLKNTMVQDRLEEMVNLMKNPFNKFYYWV